MFAFQDTLGPVEIAFTDRHGGTSGGPFASLNLAEPGTTPAGADGGRPGGGACSRTSQRRPRGPGVRRRRPGRADPARRPHAAGARGRRPRRLGRRRPPTGDGLVTAERGTVLMVRVADCVPVLLADAGRGIVVGGARRPTGPGRRGGAGRRGRDGDAGRRAHHRLGGPARVRRLLRGAGPAAGRGQAGKWRREISPG